MISDKLTNWSTLPGLASHPVWKAAFEWIEQHATTAEIGSHDLGIGSAVARVMEVAVLEREDARYESHENTIDLQYTVSGAEGIEIHPLDKLIPDGDYDVENDSQSYLPNESGTHLICNDEGNFCILFPQDGHMPKLKVDDSETVRKIVFKIPLSSVV